MRRAFALLVSGAALAAAALYLAPLDRNETAVPAADRGEAAADRTHESAARGSPDSLDAELLGLVTGSLGAAQRAGIDALAARASAAELDSLVRLLSGLPRMGGKDYALEALLEGYAAVDPRAAIALARELRVPNDLIAALHRAWASADLDAALAAAEAYGQPLATLVAVELLGVDRAIRDAQRLPQEELLAALAQIAAVAAKKDPYDALARGMVIASADARAAFTAAVYRAWAIRDPRAMLDHALGLDAEPQRAALEAGGIEAFSQLETLVALELARELSGGAAGGLRTIALMGIARKDPLAVLRYAEGLPPGLEQAQALVIAAAGYVEADPEAALAWAQSLQPPDPAVLATVLAGFARKDPSRAIDLLFASDAPPERWRLFQAVVGNEALSAQHIAAVADRLAATPGRRNDLQAFSSAWARQRPKEALEWLLARDVRGPSSIYSGAAWSLGRNDPAAAAAYLKRIPAELRPAWLRAAAEGYANADPGAAARWVGQYEGEEGYEAAVAGVAQRTALKDPPAAARVLETLDLASAAEGADAAGIIAMHWAARDVPAARDWALDLPRGGTRDAALRPVLGAVALESGRVERSLLDAFSDETAAQLGLSDAVATVARRDPDTARQIAERYLTDPALRDRVLRDLPGP